MNTTKLAPTTIYTDSVWLSELFWGKKWKKDQTNNGIINCQQITVKWEPWPRDNRRYGRPFVQGRGVPSSKHFPDQDQLAGGRWENQGSNHSQLVVRLQHLLAAGERSCLGWEPLGQSFIPQWPKDNQERCFTGKKRMDLVWLYNSFAIHNFVNWVAIKTGH